MERIISFISKVTVYPFTTTALSFDDAQNPDKTIEQEVQFEDTQEPPHASELFKT
jgi:hypothetical protein